MLKIAHVQKHTRAVTGHMCAHYDRTAENISNDKIDPTKTHLNYNLAPQHELTQTEFIKERCEEVKCLNRSDVNVMCSWVVTAPGELPEQENKQFFEESYKFMAERYGEENVVSAYVHMDETTPHMHFAFVPVVKDQKKDIEKVSAKECVNKKDLQTFHVDLDKHMEKAFGRDIGILNGATKEGNNSIEDLKRQSATERINEAKEIAKMNIHKSEEKLKNAEQTLFKAKKDIEPYREELNALKAKIKGYEGAFKTLDEIPKGKKGLLGNVTFTKEEANKLIKTAEAYWSKDTEKANAKHDLQRLEKKYSQDLKELPRLKEKVSDLNLEKIKLSKELKKITDVFKNNPKLEDLFLEAQQALSATKKIAKTLSNVISNNRER